MATFSFKLYLGFDKRTFAFRQLHSRKSIGVKLGDRGGHETSKLQGMSLRTHYNAALPKQMRQHVE